MNEWSVKLIAWYSVHKRDLPWRHTKDPYVIWLSEVILQQTRVQQGLPYFEKFVSQFPTVKDLAKAPLQEVMQCWQGLGYYSRARNLHDAAMQVVEQFGGVFPASYEDIKRLKGVGPYTAAAIASFAFDLPYAVVDGNVYRVLSRHFGMRLPIDHVPSQKTYAELAQKLLPIDHAADFNQAIMEFGAVHCVPANPDCVNCIFSSSCVAFERGEVGLLPLKAGKVKVRERIFNYILLQKDGGVYMKERTEKDIWQHLWDFELVESDHFASEAEIVAHIQQKFSFSSADFLVQLHSQEFKHILTHQRIKARFWQVQIFSNLHDEVLKFVAIKALGNKPLPRLIEKFLNTHRQWLD